MNNKKVFSVKLFWQSFKQLKLIGIISTAVLMIFSVFTILDRVIVQINEKEAGYEVTQEIINGISIHSYIILIFVIVVPLLALSAWSFLNKRSTSDFYHSLPYTRLCVYLSRVAGILAWIITVIFSNFIVTCLLYKIFNEYFLVNYVTMFKMFLAIFNCSVLCLGGITLACSFTGNMISNVCVTGIILFFPRFMMTLVSQAFSSEISVVSTRSAFPIMDNSLNMITGICFSMSDLSINELLLAVNANIYTFVLGFIYLAAGCILFIRRRSEGAGQPATGKISRFAIRVIIGFIVVVFATMSFVMEIRETGVIERESIISVVFLFIIGAVVVIIYECVSSKNIKRIISCIPAIITSYVLAIIVGIAMNLSMDAILAYRPSADDIKYVTFSQQDGWFYDIDYFDNITKSVKLDNEKIKDVFCNALKENLERIEKDEEAIYYRSEKYTKYQVYFKDGLFGKYRNIYISNSQMQIVADMLTDNSEYRAAYYDLPKPDEVRLSMNVTAKMTNEQLKSIYSSLLEEINSLKFAEWYGIVHSKYNTAMSIQFSRNGVEYSMTIPINRNFPKAYNMLCNILNGNVLDNEETVQRMIKVLEAHLDGTYKESDSDGYFEGGEKEYFYEYISMFAEAEDGETYGYDLINYLEEYGDDGRAVIKKAIEAIKKGERNTEIDFSKPVLGFSYYSETVNSVCNGIYYIQLDGYDDMKDFWDINSGVTF